MLTFLCRREFFVFEFFGYTPETALLGHTASVFDLGGGIKRWVLQNYVRKENPSWLDFPSCKRDPRGIPWPLLPCEVTEGDGIAAFGLRILQCFVLSAWTLTLGGNDPSFLSIGIIVGVKMDSIAILFYISVQSMDILYLVTACVSSLG